MTEATTSLLNQRTHNIRDKRDRRWFWTDNALIEDYGRALGIYAVGVYMVLCERAYNQTQRAEVSGGVIAELLGVGRSSVTEALFVLELHEIIDIQEQYDDETRQQLPSIYTLLSVENWRLEPTPEREEFVNARRETEKLKRTTPKAKPKRVTRRKKSEPENEGPESEQPESEHQELKQGMPPETIPPSTVAKRRGYAATRHRVSSGAAYPLVSGGKGIPSDTDKYNQDEIQDVKPDNNKQPQAAEMSVADENFSNSDLTPPAHAQEVQTPESTVREKLAQFIERRDVRASADEIDALVQKWPAAHLADDKLADALVSDYEIYHLDKPADENIARAAVKSDAARLRWFLCAWPGFEESTDEYHERTHHRWTKAQCFFKRWKTAQPPASWLEGELAELRARSERENERAAKAQAEAYFATLTERQKRALAKEVREQLEQESRGEFLDTADGRAIKRLQLLLDPDTRDWLAGLGTARERDLPDASAPKLDADAAAEEPAPMVNRPHQLSIELYVGPILQQIREKELTLRELERARPDLLDDSEWRRVKDETVRRAYAEKLVA